MNSNVFIVYDVIDGIDWSKILKCVEALDIKWEGKTPSIMAMKTLSVRLLLKALDTDKEENTVIKSNEFTAIKILKDGAIELSLQFTPTAATVIANNKPKVA